MHPSQSVTLNKGITPNIQIQMLNLIADRKLQIDIKTSIYHYLNYNRPPETNLLH